MNTTGFTKRFSAWGLTAIALLALASLLVHARKPTVVGSPQLMPTPSSSVVPSVHVAGDDRLLDDETLQRIAAKILERLPATAREASPQAPPPTLDAAAAKTAHALNRELANQLKQIRALAKYMKEVAIYTKDIERSMSVIDARLSTPTVLKQKLEQQQNRVQP